MHAISQSVIKKDHDEKVSGSIKYIADIILPDMLYAKTLRSKKARAAINQVNIPPLKEGYFIIDHLDVAGKNSVKIIVDDQPLFAKDEVRYIGEPILLVAGPEEKEVDAILAQITVDYTEKPPIYTVADAKEYIASYQYQKGDVDKAFDDAVQIIEETFETGYQEHAYIELQGVMADYQQNKITVYGSIQCPYYVKNAVVYALGFEEDQVRIVQTATGGAFGGKEEYPSLIAAQAAVAAYKTKKPVRLIMNRREDMAVTTKRHPGLLKYRTAIDKAGNISAMAIDITLNGGAYAGLSSVVLQRSIICAGGVYKIANIKVSGKAAITNTVPTGAFRGFGAPQSFFAVEMHMVHIANKLGIDPLDLKKKYMVEKGDATSTGGRFHDVIKLDEMLARAEVLSDYKQKYNSCLSQTGRYKNGIGLSIFLHGCGFTGAGERDHIRAIVRLAKVQNDQVEILVSNTEMGQGLKTTLSKIVAQILEIPLESVIYKNPDTDRVPNSGPTVASRSLMIVGKLLERAAIRLKKSWDQNETQVIEEHYVHPELIPWDEKLFKGDAYPTYSWGVNVIEVKVDTLTAMTEVIGVWGVFDVGTAIDETIMQGQIEGGMLQGIGYASMEKMESDRGAIRQSSITDYIIPTAKDIVKIHTTLIDNPYRDGPFGAKGAGELTLIGAAPAYIAAVENATGASINQIPLTPEALMEVL
ncbi:xanthine dehydrogenase family protein molybdopterin-binding subunit [Cellulosilyticum sp. I15G10I2]|uniref:xanthine dehydrogenase family protein molybdopterin-binding subunit n=1 Tax=Cellulosilyticum sp. I15G10I2 TaxID=1892843 RepID=UPI00085CD77C|nr:xanthine dehydrogenase family protein molybdopterin-binding subunit [Cellulosilyticum sp. I15G10I2]